MACEENNNKLHSVLEKLCDDGFDGVTGALITLFNEAMKLDRSRHLNAVPYERSEGRQGYANGFKPKTVKSRVGELSLQVPQVRDSEHGFYPGV